MGRTNKFTDGVFVDIVGDDKEKPAYDRFMDIQNTIKKPSKELNSFLGQYKKKINQNKLTFEELSILETIIMQIRSRDNINTDDIKLNIVREYIYARIPFHRNDKEGKDVRVIVGLTEKYGTEMENLYGNMEIMSIAKNKLISSMDIHIQNNIDKLNKIK